MILTNLYVKNMLKLIGLL